jgi:hypothetical protein
MCSIGDAVAVAACGRILLRKRGLRLLYYLCFCASCIRRSGCLSASVAVLPCVVEPSVDVFDCNFDMLSVSLCSAPSLAELFPLSVSFWFSLSLLLFIDLQFENACGCALTEIWLSCCRPESYSIRITIFYSCHYYRRFSTHS